MKFLLTGLLTFYIGFISPIKRSIFGNTCRFNLTCSQYARKMISEKGVIKGSFLSFIRVLKCQPFFKIKNVI